jgi:hypothetical protein
MPNIFFDKSYGFEDNNKRNQAHQNIYAVGALSNLFHLPSFMVPVSYLSTYLCNMQLDQFSLFLTLDVYIWQSRKWYQLAWLFLVVSCSLYTQILGSNFK